jgi:hypothetical protein
MRGTTLGTRQAKLDKAGRQAGRHIEAKRQMQAGREVRYWYLGMMDE